MKPFKLAIEDDPDLAERTRHNLERDGSFVAQAALTGEAGVNIALGKRQSKQMGRTRSAPHLFVLDLNLPGMSGFEF